jgi:peptide/nickel transport system permease protein
VPAVWVAIGLGLLLLLAAALAPVDAITPHLAHRFAAPSLAHPLGTDQLGRDLAARILRGTRISVGLTLLALVLVAAIGTAAGLAAGLRGGIAARALQTAIDVLVAIPTVVFGLILAAALRPGLLTLLVAVLIAGWTPFARLAYQLGRKEAGAGYVAAAVALGAGNWHIVVRDILPNLSRPLAVHACLRFANVLLIFAGLSFLGLGAQPPTPEWGAMLSGGLRYLYIAPRLMLAPMVGIVLVALAATALGRVLDRRWSG